MDARSDNWASGDAYETYMGRWSRPIARSFIGWLQREPAGHWLDVGCGTGALTSAILEIAGPASIAACDPSTPFVEDARRRVADPRVTFAVAGSADLPTRDGGFDAIVSGLVLNFIPDPEAAVSAMRARLRARGCVAAYVWDYAEGFEPLRCFWDEAVALDPDAARLDQGRRFPLCRPEMLAALFRGAGLDDVETGPLEHHISLASFDEYWEPFLGGTGPAPAYVASLTPGGREALRERLSERLRRRIRPDADGRINLTARAWAVRGLSGLTGGHQI
jgi:SAM-dependent methyltransferase